MLISIAWVARAILSLFFFGGQQTKKTEKQQAPSSLSLSLPLPFSLSLFWCVFFVR